MHRMGWSRLLIVAVALAHLFNSRAVADPLQTTAQCMSGMRSELDRINAQMASIEAEQDQPGEGYLVKQEGRCARILRRIDHYIPTVLKSEVDKMERRACLEVDKLRIDNYCKCGANLGDTSVPDDQIIDQSIDAQKGFQERLSKVRKRGIKNPAIEAYVNAGQQLVGCWSAKSVAMLKRASYLIDQETSAPALTVSPIDGGNPTVSPIDGGNPSVSAIDGGNPSVSAIDGGAPQSGISGANQSSAAAQQSTSGVVTYTTPSSSTPVGSSSQYTTSGPATNITQDIIDLSNSYNRSANSLNSVRTSSHAPAPSAPSRPASPMQPPHSGISGTHR